MSGPFFVAVSPTMQLSVRLSAASASSSIDWSRLYAATGIITFSSKLLPWSAANATD